MAVGLLSCDYQSFISGGGTRCVQCDGQSNYQMTDYTCYSCENRATVPSYLQEKFDFICEGDQNFHVYNPLIVVFAVFGAILFTLLCCICIIVLKLKRLICIGANASPQEEIENR